MTVVKLPKRYVPFFMDTEYMMELALENPETRKQILEITASANDSLVPRKSGAAIYVGTSGDESKISEANKLFKS